MRQKKAKFSAVLLFSLGLTGLLAQEALLTTGGDASGSGGSVSYSIGQIFCTSGTGTNGTVSQGVQQPFEISAISGFEQAKDITLHYKVYPNPTTDHVRLKVDKYTIDKISYQLYDINGKILENKKIESNETTISMVDLLPATYFLRVTDDFKKVKTFKIIKK